MPTSNSAQDLQDATERLRAHEAADSSAFLGRLCFYSVPEAAQIDHMTFCRELVTRRFDRFHLPHAPKPVDVFRRATKGVQERILVPDGPHVNLMMRELITDKDEVVRQLVREVVDADNRKLFYGIVATITFKRKTGFINTHYDPPAPAPRNQKAAPGQVSWAVDQACRPVEEHALDAIKNEYASGQKLLTAYAVRETIRKILFCLGATLMRDGLYFVGEANVDRVRDLEEMVNALPGANFHSLPLVDDQKQREMLKSAFMDESVGQIDELLGRMKVILEDDKTRITKDRYADLQARRAELAERAGGYAEMLEADLEKTQSRLQILDEQLWALLERVKPDA